MSQKSLNQLKVESARERILGINPWIQIDVSGVSADDQNVHDAVAGVQCIADCTDRFATRFLANRLALKYRVPTVSAAALGVEGQLTTIDLRDPENLSPPPPFISLCRFIFGHIFLHERGGGALTNSLAFIDHLNIRVRAPPPLAPACQRKTQEQIHWETMNFGL